MFKVVQVGLKEQVRLGKNNARTYVHGFAIRGMLQLALTGYPAQMCICGMAYRKYLVYPYLCIRRTYRRGRTLRHPWSACINNQAQGTASGLLALPGNACSAGMGLTLRLEAKRRCLRAKLDEVKKWHNCASCICSLQSRVASP